MGTRWAATKTCLVLLFLVVLSLLSGPGVPNVHATTTASIVYVDPVSSGGVSFQKAGSSFMLSIKLNLTSGQQLNTFDVRLNYSNAFVVLKADNISYSGNIFSSFTALPILSCIDAVAVASIGGTCESDQTPDTIGQVHLSLTMLPSPSTSTVMGPVNGGLLFSVGFHVVGNGTSIFALDKANLIDPVGSDPANPNPHPIASLKQGGVFANKGIVAFFNAVPTDSAAYLPGHPILFDASGSFDANHTTPIPIGSYNWTFGDSTPIDVQTVATANHVFAQPGSYPVSLAVKTSGNQESNSTRQNVVIVPALGDINVALRDTNDNALSDPVSVRLLNSSSSTPFASRNTLGTASFNNLSPGQYTLRISGPSIRDYSKVEVVEPGLTTHDTVRLSLIPAPPDYSGIVFFGSTGFGVGVFAIFMVMRLRRRRAEKKEKALQSKKAD